MSKYFPQTETAKAEIEEEVRAQLGRKDDGDGHEVIHSCEDNYGEYDGADDKYNGENVGVVSWLLPEYNLKVFNRSRRGEKLIKDSGKRILALV